MICTFVGLVAATGAGAVEGGAPNPFGGQTGDSGASPGQGVAPGRTGSTVVRVDPRICRRAVAHVPDPGVAYTPGVDVRGNAVAPADMEDWSAITGSIEKGFVMDLAIDPFAASGSTAPEALQNPSVSLGTLRYDAASNRFTLNGRPLGSSEEARLAAACRQQAAGR